MRSVPCNADAAKVDAMTEAPPPNGSPGGQLAQLLGSALAKAHPLSTAQRKELRRHIDEAAALAPRAIAPLIRAAGVLAQSRDSKVAETATSRILAYARRARGKASDDTTDADLLEIQGLPSRSTASHAAAGMLAGGYSPGTSLSPPPGRRRSIPGGSSPRSIVNPEHLAYVEEGDVGEVFWRELLERHVVRELRSRTGRLASVGIHVQGGRGHPLMALVDPADCIFERWPSPVQEERAALESKLARDGRWVPPRSQLQGMADPEVRRLKILRGYATHFPPVPARVELVPDVFDFTGFGAGCSIRHRPSGVVVSYHRMSSFACNRARCEAVLETILALNTLRPVRLSAIEIAAGVFRGFYGALCPEAQVEVDRLRDYSEQNGGKVESLWTWPEKLPEAIRKAEEERLMLHRARRRVANAKQRKKNGKRKRRRGKKRAPSFSLVDPLD